MTADPDPPADAQRRALDLAVQDPANRTTSTVRLAAALGVDVGLIAGRRDDTIRICFRWPDGTPVDPPRRLREIFGEVRGPTGRTPHTPARPAPGTSGGGAGAS